MNPNILEAGDIAAIVLYFVFLLFVSFFSMWQANRNTVNGYFLAGRFMTCLPVGASLFASNIGSEHFIGLAGSGAAGGIGVGAFEINALIILQLLGWVFLPVYISSKASTLPEFMKKRFGGQRIQIYLAVLSMFLYILTKVSVNMYSAALFIKLSLGWNLYFTIFLLLVMTAICTVAGGLTTVIYTDTFQTVVMLVGASILAAFSFKKVGGITGLAENYTSAVPKDLIANFSCGIPRHDSWSLLRDPITGDIPWPGFIFGQTTASIWYWCTDQMMVQRVLAAKSLSHAQGGTIFAGYLKLFPLFLIVMPGMISRVLYPDEVACVVPEKCLEICGNAMGCSNIAYPKLVFTLLPEGLRGLMLAVMISALMSDLTSIFNSSSTLFTIDIWKTYRKCASTRELLLVGRIFIVVMILLSLLWVPVIENLQGGQLFLYIQAVSSYLAPPVAAIYILAIMWKRFNEQGAFWGIMFGIVLGISRMILDFVYPEPGCGAVDNRPAILADMHFLYFAIVLFWSTAISGIIIALLTSPPSNKMIKGTTFWTRFDSHFSQDDIEMEETKIGDKFLKNGDVKDNVNNECEKSAPSLQPSIWHRCFNIICGLNSISDGKLVNNKNTCKSERIPSLKQDPKAKLILNLNLIVVLILAMFIFVVFSFDKPLLI